MQLIASASDVAVDLVIVEWVVGAAVAGLYLVGRWLGAHGLGFAPWPLTEETARRRELRAYSDGVKAIGREHDQHVKEARSELK